MRLYISAFFMPLILSLKEATSKFVETEKDGLEEADILMALVELVEADIVPAADLEKLN